MTTVLLVRHGETDWNANRRVQGWAPVELNDRGREQARAVGRHLADTYDVSRVVASDLRRTRETTALVRDAGVEPAPLFTSDWRERSFGDLQGLEYEVVFGEYPQYDIETSGVPALRVRPDGGESMLDVHERVLRGWHAVLASGETDTAHVRSTADRGRGDLNGNETVIVITHGGPIYVVLGYLDGVDLVGAMSGERQSNCAINEIRVDPDAGIDIVRRNDTSYRE